jgi:hypothetical protein
VTVIITWLALTAAGLVLTLWLLIDVYRDLHLLDVKKIANGRRYLVKGDIRSAWVKVGAFSFFVIIGVVSLLRELEVTNIDPNVSRIGLLIGSALLVWDAIVARQVRHVLLSDTNHGP